MFIANILSAQTELVRWNNSNLTATTYNGNLTAQNLGVSGINFNSLTWDVSFFEMSNLTNDTSIDLNKYLQFAVAPNSNYKLTLASFNLTYRSQASGQQFQIRYSTNSDFSNPQTLTTVTTTDNIWHSLSQGNFTNPVVAPGKTLYIRFYVYNGKYNSFHISNGNAGIAPNITGTVSVDTPSAPVANNDSFTTYKNNDADFNILSNDISSTSITGITITQQPTHGTLTVNGITNVTYKPTVGYTGTDSFKYKVSNATGASNEATASINVVENVDAALARWNNSNYTPSSSNGHLIVGNLTSTTNLSYVSNINVSGYNAFQTSGWPDKNVQTVDTSKYIQLTISPKAGYKLNLSEFNFLCVMQGGDAYIKIDYSLNSSFTNPKNLLPETTITSNVSTFSLTNFSKPIATDGQVLYLRIYVYNTWNAMQILLKDGQNAGPVFNGTVEYSSTVPIAYNDTVTNIVNNDIDINVLVNDDYSNLVTSIAYTQPAHGTTAINADRTINYIPAKDYVGADSFTYSITNQYGVSNAATVSISNNANSTTPLVRWDQNNFTATPFQSFINSTTMTTAGGMSIAVGGETNPKAYYLVSSGNTNAINSSRYAQFVFDNTSSNKTIEPKTFSYIAKGTPGATFEIRYSKNSDFSNPAILATGAVTDIYTLKNFSFDNTLRVGPNEKLYIRLYFYNSDYVQFVFQYLPGASGPEIGGLFYNNIFASTDTIWQNSANPQWSNGTPTASKNAIIDTNYNTALYGNIESNNLTINAGAILKINKDNNIKVNGQIINNGTASNFIVENDANLLQNSIAQNTGNITVQKSAVIPKMGYNYWSSPVASQNLYQFSEGYNQATTTGTGTPWNRFYLYNEANDYFVTTLANDITLGVASAFQAGRGYAIRGKNSFPETVTTATPSSLFEFKGVPQNGDYSFTLKYTNAAHGYNMVGNPYPSNINFDDVFNYNSTKIYGVAYCWTNNDNQVISQQSSNYQGNNYAIYNGTGGLSATYFGYNNRKPNGYISVGQGFIVQARAAGKNQPLVFNNAMREADNANFYNKAAQKDRFWLEFKSPTNVNNEILLGYIPNATNNYDSDYDTELLAVGNDSFWSVLDNRKLGIQARQANLSNDDVIRLGIKASVSGNYTISITDKEGIFASNQIIYLKDKYLNKVVDIRNNPYVFATNSGQYEDRFEVVYRFTETLGTDNSVKKGIQIYKDTQDFIIKSDENLDDVSMYDSVGRLIFSSKNSKKEVLINKTNLAEGMYIIKANSKNTTMTKKVLK